MSVEDQNSDQQQAIEEAVKAATEDNGLQTEHDFLQLLIAIEQASKGNSGN